MSQQNTPGMSVGCSVADNKASMPQGVCELFVREMAQAFPDRGVMRAGADSQPEVVLVIEQASDSRFVARIDTASTQGPSLATARKGAPLDDTALATLFRGLIQSTPGL